MQRLEEKLRKQLTGEWYGSRVSLMKGTGVTIRDTRRYQPGDAVRAINRKKTAKHEQLYVNQFDADQIVSVDLYLDINANWTTGVRHTNRVKIQQFLGDYRLFAQEHQLHTHVMYPTPTELARTRVVTSVQAWSCMQDIDASISMYTTKSYLSHVGEFLEEIRLSSKRRVVIIISDFLLGDAAVWEQIDELALRHALVLIHLTLPKVIGHGVDRVTLRQKELPYGGFSLSL